MPEFIMTEGSGRFKTMYGDYQAPIVSCIEDVCEAWEQKSVAPLIFREQKSTHFAEGYTGTTAMDEWLPVGENGAHPNNGFTEGYPKTLYNEVFKSQFSISRELVDDNQIGTMMNRAKKFTNAYYRTREAFFARLLGEATKGNSTISINGRDFDCTAADGLALFHKEHKGKVSGKKQTNKYADAFSAAALFKMMTAYQNLQGENGEVLGLCPDTLVIPNDATMKEAAYAAVNSYSKPGGNNNDANPLLGNFNIIVWPYLNQFITGSPWVIMDSKYNEDADGAIYQNRVDMEVRSVLGDNDENIWKGYARFTGGFVDWRCMMVGGITGGSTL